MAMGAAAESVCKFLFLSVQFFKPHTRLKSFQSKRPIVQFYNRKVMILANENVIQRIESYDESNFVFLPSRINVNPLCIKSSDRCVIIPWPLGHWPVISFSHTFFSNLEIQILTDQTCSKRFDAVKFKSLLYDISIIFLCLAKIHFYLCFEV